MKEGIWLFAYGSLLWRPGVDFVHSDQGRVTGWSRRFWQGSPDHRGTPENPGRVVTLVRHTGRSVTGRLYLLSPDLLATTLSYLDHRESGGYSRCWLSASRADGSPVRALTYVALPGNPYFLGPASNDELKHHIAVSEGPSGRNIDYYHDLVDSLQRLELSDGELSDIRISWR